MTARALSVTTAHVPSVMTAHAPSVMTAHALSVKTAHAPSLQASYDVNLIRFFGNIDGRGQPAGYGYTDTTEKAILVSIDPITLAGTYNETNFQRFDLVLAQACKPQYLAGSFNSKVFNTGAYVSHIKLHIII